MKEQELRSKIEHVLFEFDQYREADPKGFVDDIMDIIKAIPHERVVKPTLAECEAEVERNYGGLDFKIKDKIYIKFDWKCPNNHDNEVLTENLEYAKAVIDRLLKVNKEQK